VYFDIDYVRNAKSVNYWRNRYDLCTVNVVTGRCGNLVSVVICLMSRVITESTIFLRFVLFCCFSVKYRDGVGNTVEENSSVFSLIRMR